MNKNDLYDHVHARIQKAREEYKEGDPCISVGAASVLTAECIALGIAMERDEGKAKRSIPSPNLLAQCAALMLAGKSDHPKELLEDYALKATWLYAYADIMHHRYRKADEMYEQAKAEKVAEGEPDPKADDADEAKEP